MSDYKFKSQVTDILDPAKKPPGLFGFSFTSKQAQMLHLFRMERERADNYLRHPAFREALGVVAKKKILSTARCGYIPLSQIEDIYEAGMVVLAEVFSVVARNKDNTCDLPGSNPAWTTDFISYINFLNEMDSIANVNNRKFDFVSFWDPVVTGKSTKHIDPTRRMDVAKNLIQVCTDVNSFNLIVPNFVDPLSKLHFKDDVSVLLPFLLEDSVTLRIISEIDISNSSTINKDFLSMKPFVLNFLTANRSQVHTFYAKHKNVNLCLLCECLEHYSNQLSDILFKATVASKVCQEMPDELTTRIDTVRSLYPDCTAVELFNLCKNNAQVEDAPEIGIEFSL